MNVLESGLLGEWRAARYLQKQGMRVTARRFRCKGGEIDLVMRDGDVLVFVEVKYRPGGKIGDGMRAIDGEKRRCMRRAAAAYLGLHPHESIRFDAVEISAAGIRHWKNIM